MHTPVNAADKRTTRPTGGQHWPSCLQSTAPLAPKRPLQGRQGAPKTTSKQASTRQQDNQHTVNQG